MLNYDNREPLARIETTVRSFLKDVSPSRPILPSEDLENLGLASMDMVNLMLAVEAEFDLTIPGSKLIPANFRSLEKVAALIMELKPQAMAG